jgi:poly-gamma-glutamate synthesis protein (capsule biosynthesis protein)
MSAKTNRYNAAMRSKVTGEPARGAVLVLVLACTLPACSTSVAGSEPRGDMVAQRDLDRERLASEPTTPALSPPPEAEPEPAPWALPSDYLHFEGACTPGTHHVLAFAGDLLLHQELQKQAYKAKDGAAVLWSNIADLLAAPDAMLLNLEGPLAPGLDVDGLEVADPGKTYDRVVYTAYPRFNYHPSIAKDLVKAGVDLVTTANNHALDRGPLGVDRTIASLDAAKLAWVGTREQSKPERWYRTLALGDLQLAFVACTTSTNQRPDDYGQVLRCGDGKSVGKLIGQLLAPGKSGKSKADAVIVLPHWGKEYVHEPRESEQTLAAQWIEAGALAVIGSHPHVVQPWARQLASDGREGLVFYSLGNFASHQPELERRASVLLYLDLVDVEGGPPRIAGVRWLPLHVRQSGQEFFVEAIDRVQAPADARALLVRLLGASNLVLPDEPKRGDPHCDPSWRPHAIPEWALLPEPTPDAPPPVDPA